MKALVGVVAAALVALLIGAMPQVAAAQAQQPQAPAATPAPAEGAKNIVEGKIKSVTGNTLMLEDGTKLMLSSAIKVNRADLKPGAMIKANFEEQAGQKVATSLEVQKTQ